MVLPKLTHNPATILCLTCLFFMTWPAHAQDDPTYSSIPVIDVVAGFGTSYSGGEFLSMAIDTADGAPMLAYSVFDPDAAAENQPFVQRRADGVLMLTLCDDLQCAKPEHIIYTEDADNDGTTDNIGYDADIALNPATSSPIAIYRNQTTGALRMLICSPAAMLDTPADKCRVQATITVDPGDIANGIYAGLNADVAINDSGQAYIVYRRAAGPGPDAPPPTIELVRCDLQAATCETLQSLSDVGNLRNFLSLALIPDSQIPVVSYNESSGPRPPSTRLRLLTCSDADCSTIQRVNLDGDAQDAVPPYQVGFFSDLAFVDANTADDDLELIVVYIAQNNQDGDRGMVLTVCDESPPYTDCNIDDADANLQRVRLYGLGQAPSIAIDSATGWPLIAFQDTETTSLALLRCGSADCADTDANTVVVSLGGQDAVVQDTGRQTSLALEKSADGVTWPVIAHYNATQQRPELYRPDAE
jgi:hypothetical protein